MIVFFVAIFNAFLKSFDSDSLDNLKNSAFVQIQAEWERKITEVLRFWFAPSEININKFCKAFQKNAFHQIKFILWFFGLKTCKYDSYLQKV